MNVPIIETGYGGYLVMPVENTQEVKERKRKHFEELVKQAKRLKELEHEVDGKYRA